VDGICGSTGTPGGEIGSGPITQAGAEPAARPSGAFERQSYSERNSTPGRVGASRPLLIVAHVRQSGRSTLERDGIQRTGRATGSDLEHMGADHGGGHMCEAETPHCVRWCDPVGLAALADRSTVVRYRACGLCAYPLRQDALPGLRLLVSHKDKRTSEDAAAAIDAIEQQNHHLFVDREHSGRSFWVINEGDRQQVQPGSREGALRHGRSRPSLPRQASLLFAEIDQAYE
jgi:hypothetical protein